MAEGGPAVAACIKFITIYSGYVAKSKFHSGEIWAPVAAMLEARQAKGRANILLARFLYCGGERCGGGSRAERPHIYGAIIDPLALGLPLGWQLSKLSLAWVREAAQLRDACPSFTEPWPTEELARRRRIWIEENGCLYSRIARDLTGR